MSNPVWMRNKDMEDRSEGWYWCGGSRAAPLDPPELHFTSPEVWPEMAWLAKADPVLPKMPRPKLKVDDPVLVRGLAFGANEWQPRHFAGWDIHGMMRCWNTGKTSHTSEKSETSPWTEWKLPESKNDQPT